MSLEKVSHSSFTCPAPDVKHILSVVSSTHSAVVEKHPEGSLQHGLALTRKHRLPVLVRHLWVLKKKKQASSCFSNKQLTKLLYPKCYVFIDAPQAFKAIFHILLLFLQDFLHGQAGKLIAYNLCFLCNCCRSPATFLRCLG